MLNIDLYAGKSPVGRLRKTPEEGVWSQPSLTNHQNGKENKHDQKSFGDNSPRKVLRTFGTTQQPTRTSSKAGHFKK